MGVKKMATSISLPVLLCALQLSFMGFSEGMNADSDYLQRFLEMTGMNEGLYNFESPVCTWTGVDCDRDNTHIVNVTVTYSGLHGEIPEGSLGKLASLAYLDLTGNNLTGLSSDIWGLSNLRSLHLSNNKLTGPFPSNIGNFARLRSLHLSENKLSGLLSPALGSLTELQYLNLSHNMLNGSIPVQVFTMKSLVELDLSHNQFTGRIPQELSQTMPLPLRTLCLAENHLEGHIQDFNAFQVSHLNISGNLFTGQLQALANLTSLKTMDLSKNAFTGSVDSAIFTLPHISVLKFSMNNLSGKLSVFLIPTLREFDASRNKFGSWNLRLKTSSLTFLDVSANRMTGSIPKELHMLTSLKFLNLAANNFTRGNFPDLTYFRSLEYLNLSSCKLNGPLPSSVFKLEKLQVLDLSKNQFSGTIPSLDISRDTTLLTYVDLSVNKLVGVIPFELVRHLQSMSFFNFSYNQLTVCDSRELMTKFPAAFKGLSSQCPIAVNPNTIPSKDGKKPNLALALGLALGLFFIGLLSLATVFRKNLKWLLKQSSFKEEKNLSGPFSFEADSYSWAADIRLATMVPVVIFEKPLLNLTFADILTATNHFNKDTLLAEGRYGPVYGAVLLGSFHVAIKVLVSNGNILSDPEAAAIFERLGKIKHPNLIPMLGYCLAGDKKLAIYEFMDNGNVHHWLHDLPLGMQATENWNTDSWDHHHNLQSAEAGLNMNMSSLIEWKLRHRIALGTARSLAFLHHGCYPPIVHQDVKSSSIYLDGALNPYLADFGLADITSGVSLPGMSGYDPPEYGETSTICSKWDVYGFGVVLFELLTGKKPINDNYPGSDETTLVGWARKLVKSNVAVNFVDPKLSEVPTNQLKEALRIAYLCTADSPLKRPTMQQIVLLLKDLEPGM